MDVMLAILHGGCFLHLVAKGSGVLVLLRNGRKRRLENVGGPAIDGRLMLTHKTPMK